MKKTVFFNTIYGIGMLSLISCTHNPDLTKVRTVSFNTEVLPIFQTNCATSGCHDNSTKESGYELNNYGNIMTGISAGNANKSKLYKEISSPLITMPPSSRNPLNQDQRSLIYVWIEQGAKNN